MAKQTTMNALRSRLSLVEGTRICGIVGWPIIGVGIEIRLRQ